MPPQTQDMEAFFKNVEKLEGLPGDFDAEEGSTKDFESFFEKLSSLDDLNWSDGGGPPAGGRKPGQTAAKAPGAQAVGTQGARNAQPSAWDTGAGRESPRPRKRGPGGMVFSATKFLLLALALFFTGLTAGFLALSIPHQTGTKMPGVAALVTPQTGVETATAENPALHPGKATVEGQVAEPAEPGTLTITENGHIKARLTAPGNPAISPEAAAAKGVTRVAPVAPAAAEPARPAVRTAQPQPPATAGGSYALQVGACQSAACVTRYKAILSPLVEQETIQVMVKAGAPGQEPIRRVRIEPLHRGEALALRERLAAADVRFGSAYLVNRR